MNKKTGIVIAVIVVIIILAVIFGLSHKAATPAQQMVQAEMMHGSMQALLASGQYLQCSIITGTSTEITQGTVYVGNGEFRGDFVANYNGTSTNAHVIDDSQNVYVWTDSMAQGFEMAAPQGTSTPVMGSSHGVDVNASYDYSCTPWTADASVFTPPTNVTFSAMVAPSSSGITVSPQCSACAQAPAQYQSVCEAQFCK